MRLLALTLGCRGCAHAIGARTSSNGAIKGSLEELSLWSRTPDLFDSEELQVLLVRQAIACLKPQMIESCVKGGAGQAECSCVSEGILAAFEGDELLDLSERMRNGSAVPPRATGIKLECASQFGRRR